MTNSETMMDIRPSPIAGTWYPGEPDVLGRALDQQLKACDIESVPGTVVGVIAPHAGHRYSGQVAAYAFSCLAGLSPEIVVVVSPLHGLEPGSVLTTGHEAYQTPLGLIPVHGELIEMFGNQLQDEHLIKVEAIRADTEHSLEIELPFLQRILPQPFHLLPIMIRDQSSSVAESVGHTLGTILKDESVVLVASSDLSHFYSAEIAKQYDQELLARVEAFDPAAVLSAEEEGSGFACGRGAIAAVLWAARDLGADRVKILNHATSGDVTGDDSSVVGYGAAVIYRADKD